jgi:hypothetical protein
VYVLACAAFAGILFVRGGPNPAETDAHAVTYPTTAIAHGDLRLAARETYVPNPPGYPLLMAPLVAVFGHWIGSPRWCDDKAVPALLLGPADSYYRSILGPCRRTLSAPDVPVRPIWYRSQAALVVVAWIVLMAGALMLVRAAGAGGGVGELVLVAALLALPATTDAVAQSFHPQDLMSVGFSCAAVAQALRRRWLAVGLLFGAAFLCKQFALLAALGVLAAAPGRRERARIVLPALGLVAAGVLPFYVADRVATVHALTGVYVSGVGVVKTPTVIGLLGVAEQSKLEMARDLPVLLAAGLAASAWWRGRRQLLAPAPLVGLVLACTATRLVFEVSILDYYFLAVGVALLVFAFVRKRPPWWAVTWIVATRFGLTWMAPRAPSGLTAAAFLLAALVPMVMGLAAVVELPRASLPDEAVRGVST